MKKYSFVWDAFCIDLESLYDLETGCALSGLVTIVLADAPYNASSARGQASSAYDFLPTKDPKNALSVVSSVTAPGAQSQNNLCSDLVFLHLSKSLCAR